MTEVKKQLNRREESVQKENYSYYHFRWLRSLPNGRKRENVNVEIESPFVFETKKTSKTHNLSRNSHTQLLASYTPYAFAIVTNNATRFKVAKYMYDDWI